MKINEEDIGQGGGAEQRRDKTHAFKQGVMQEPLTAITRRVDQQGGNA